MSVIVKFKCDNCKRILQRSSVVEVAQTKVVEWDKKPVEVTDGIYHLCLKCCPTELQGNEQGDGI